MNGFNSNYFASQKKFEKLNLSQDAVNRYWERFGGDRVLSVLNEMDSKDKWAEAVVRHPTVRETLDSTVGILENPQVPDEAIKNNIDDFIYILGYMRTSTVFRILKWLEKERNPVLYALLERVGKSGVEESETTEQGYMTAAGMLKHRLMQFVKLNRLSLILSEERITKVHNWLVEFEQEEYAADTEI